MSNAFSRIMSKLQQARDEDSSILEYRYIKSTCGHEGFQANWEKAFPYLIVGPRVIFLVDDRAQVSDYELSHAREIIEDIHHKPYKLINVVDQLKKALNAGGRTHRCVRLPKGRTQQDMKKTFTLTDEHIALLKNMFVDWDDCEWGAPAVDPKRPYGNSYVYGDIAEILLWPNPDDEEDCAEMDKVHRETLTALQILIQHAEVLRGDYQNESSPYSPKWEKV